MIHWNNSGPHIQRNGGFARFFNLRKTAKEVILVLDNHGLDTEFVLFSFGGEWDGKGLDRKSIRGGFCLLFFIWVFVSNTIEQTKTEVSKKNRVLQE